MKEWKREQKLRTILDNETAKKLEDEVETRSMPGLYTQGCIGEWKNKMEATVLLGDVYTFEVDLAWGP